MANILNELAKLFPDLFSIEYNSVVGKVVVLHNKKFQIPNSEEIKKILFGNNNW